MSANWYRGGMTPREVRAAREKLGLTEEDFARVLDTSPAQIRRIESPEDMPSHRPLAVRMSKLIQAMLQGFKPDDWDG